MDEPVKSLKQRMAELEIENTELKADNAYLQERILDLEACR